MTCAFFPRFLLHLFSLLPQKLLEPYDASPAKCPSSPDHICWASIVRRYSGNPPSSLLPSVCRTEELAQNWIAFLFQVAFGSVLILLGDPELQQELVVADCKMEPNSKPPEGVNPTVEGNIRVYQVRRHSLVRRNPVTTLHGTRYHHTL